MKAWIEEYRIQHAQRSVNFAESGTEHPQKPRPWISLLDRRPYMKQHHETSDLNLYASDCDSDLEVYSDSGLQNVWSETAVDVKVRLSRGSPAYATVVRIDSMSNGCFISRRLLDRLEAAVDKRATKPFQCPLGPLETEGTVILFVYWRDRDQRQHRREVKFNVPKEWRLETVDLLVTVPMAKRLGIDRVAYAIEEPGNLLAAIERIYGGVVFSKQDKSAKAAADKAIALKAQENLESEAERRQRRQKLRHSNQPGAHIESNTPARS